MFLRPSKHHAKLRRITSWLALVVLISAGTSLAREKFKDDKAEPVRLITPGKCVVAPTHHFRVPTTQVLNHREFVLSFHEWSLGIDHGLQIFISPTASLGGIFLGAKYAVSPALAVGAGLAPGWTFPDIKYHPYAGAYVDHASTGLMGFASVPMGKSKDAFAGLGLWDGISSVEAGFGASQELGQFTRIFYEIRGSVEFGWVGIYNQRLALNTGVGLSYSLPTLPQLKIALGILPGMEVVNTFSQRDRFIPGGYIDLSYGSCF